MVDFPTMEAYKRETDLIVNRFVAHEIDFPECIAALDAALAGFMPMMNKGNIDEVRAVMLANNEIVMKEMERRSSLLLFKNP